MKTALSLTLSIVGVLLLLAAAKIPFLYGSSAAPVAIILAERNDERALLEREE